MDDGVVALVAAGIGVGGVVVASAMGWRGARMAASAQVEAALAGVREQAKLEQGVALRAARRAAYGEFLGQVEMVRMALDRAVDVSEQAADANQYYLETHLPPTPTPDWPATRARMEESVDALWFRHSALRLYVDDQIADEAEALVRMAREAADIFHLVTDAVNEEYDPAPHYASIREKVAVLKVGTRAWANSAAASLEQPLP
ncbi:hypothetical protein NEH83_36995 [Streptomyces sp. JUS-F4]|uniref:hypothetical protein n=1 Tax=Streptomyces TaxID=1883 RepID=UPI0011B04A3B|nr:MULTISPECIES: hypothetical protein [unclassified Streptomyces]WKN12737.1 hypothetical protein NEH83_00055 [Streptomyces sp. JUS-F4]WKN19287.1 hypothetical protein NEH83_36995 [Streptomyces sp. JUS-F4]